ncbi:MAG: helix-hairpin-helix domain-containing protein [Candidatus Njordarchaeota archaeon]
MGSKAKAKPTISDIPGISGQTVQKLKNAGFYYAEDLLIFSPTKLSEIAGISKELAEKVLDKVAELLYSVKKEQTLREFIEEAGKKKFMSTGSFNLNRLLQGGWCVGEVTEIAGEYATGKSQAIYTALAIAFLRPLETSKIQEILNLEIKPTKRRKKEEKKAETGSKKKKGGDITLTHYGLDDGDITVLLIDAERTFNWQRFEKILARFGLSLGDVGDRFFIHRPRNSWELKAEIDRLHRFVRENNTKLIAIDSITKLPRADFSGVGQLYERQRLILEMTEKLRRIAQTYDIVVLVTNQVVAVPGSFGFGYKPVGGHVLGHTVDTRLLLVKSGEYRRILILDSSWLPPGECKIKISEGGIEDA